MVLVVTCSLDNMARQVSTATQRMERTPTCRQAIMFRPDFVRDISKLDQVNCANSSFESYEKKLHSALVFGLILFGKHT